MLASAITFLSKKIANYLSAPVKSYVPIVKYDACELANSLEIGDVLLVEGELRISSAIKYLTQSTWSHSAIFVGEFNGKRQQLIEADMREGVRAIDVATYENFHVRICRPVNLRTEDAQALVAYLQTRLGDTYDLDNVIDLIRYLLPNPPVPSKWRRGLLALGSGEPTKAICSTLIAQAFAHINYPILPIVNRRLATDVATHQDKYVGIFRERNYSLYVPRDFDVSPYFQIIKPTLVKGFDYKQSIWD